MIVPSPPVFDHFFSDAEKKLSPHKRFINLSTSILNFDEYISANSFRVKAQP